MRALSPAKPPSPFAVFHHRAFVLLWTAQLVSTSGSALTALAASIFVYRLTGSAFNVGLMMMATAVPSLFVGLIAGVFVDRWDRKRIMVATDVSRAVLVLLIPVLLPYSVGCLYVIVAVSSAIGQFFEPAHASTLPEVATDDQLTAANALMQISAFGASAVGFAASGLIAALYSVEWAFYLDGVSFLVSATCIALTRLPHGRTAVETQVTTVFRNLRAGMRHLFATPILRSLFLSCVPAFLGVGLLNAVLLPFMLRALGATEFEYGLVEALSSAGFVAGALLMARLGDRLHEGQWIAISYLSIGVGCALLAFSTNVPVAVLLYTVCGLVNAPNYVGRSLIIQRHTTRDLRGRVNSAFLVLRNVVFLIGMAAAGLADTVGVRVVYVGGALIVFLAGLLVLGLPGLGQPAAEWRRALQLLRGAATAPGLGRGRAAMVSDVDVLARQVPAFATLSMRQRHDLTAQTRVHEVPSGTTIVRRGETSSDAYCILAGRAVAGREEAGQYRELEPLSAGDFFGEIAALTNLPRTANVVAEQPLTLLQIPAATLRDLLQDEQLNQLFLTRMTERMLRMNMLDVPRFGGLSQSVLRDLRLPDDQTAAAKAGIRVPGHQ